MSDEMNYYGRFQYAVFPIILMSWPSVIKGIDEELKLQKLTFSTSMKKYSFI